MAEVAVGAVMDTAMEAKKMTEGEWEDPPVEKLSTPLIILGSDPP